ncbi:MAG: hypothetical protein ACRD2S_03670 [Terriglobales bacterium]
MTNISRVARWPSFRPLAFHFLFGLGLLVSLMPCMAQTASAPADLPSAEKQQDRNPPVETENKNPEKQAQPLHAENKITSKEADELFREVDQILQFASRDTDLPIKHPVKSRLTSRDEVVAYLQKSMLEDKDAKRLRRSELVLKKFGLLPQDFDLGKFLVGLLKEQIAGYYDPKTKVVNLLDWVDVAAQRPVLAHELTHALQDQSFNLNKWMTKTDIDLETKRKPSALDVQDDETSEARQAVVEGQAMAVLVDYMLRPVGQSLVSSPEVAEALEDGMLTGTPDSVEFRSAPIYLREALTFPYRYGLEFEAALLRAGGKQRAYADAFMNPPRTTRQIMEPETYLSGERVEPLPLPNFKRILKKYKRFDIGALGEFDVAVLMDQYAGTEASHRLYPGWRGGYYYAALPKGHPAAPLGLLYVSRWVDSNTASEFAAIYAKYLPKRYAHVSGSPSENKDAANIESLEHLSGLHMWMTENGPVVIDVEGSTVFISESLDQSTTDSLETAVFGAKK